MKLNAYIIFLHNVLICFLIILVGFVGSRLFMLILLVYQVVFIGLQIYMVLMSSSVLFTVLSIVPHGVFEIPAVAIAYILGLKACKHEDLSLGLFLRQNIKLIVLMIALLGVAAYVEANITPTIIRPLIKH